MKKRLDKLTNGKYKFNSLHKAIVFSFPAVYLGFSMSAIGAQTLTDGQDIYVNGLNTGTYDLLLNGDVSWNTAFNINSAGKSTIAIDGNGNIITISTNSGQRLFDINQALDTISIKNATITADPFSGARSTLIKIDSSKTTLNLNLEGTTFLNIGPTNYTSGSSADYGPILSIRGGSGSVMNIEGGIAGLLFKGNHGLWDQPGAVGLYSDNTMNFNGKVTFDSNWTGNYGGAVTVYESNGSVMNFNGEANFINNHSSVFGGAIDSWGGAATLTFNGPTNFTGNYVYGSTVDSLEYPNHVNDQHSRGGAINIGYLNPGSAGVLLNFNNTVTFKNNFVVETKNNRDALGGAVSAYGNGGNYNYLMNFNGATTFDGNYVYSLTGDAYGGAIYYDAGNKAVLNLGPGSTVTNNVAKTQGGAIYLEGGTINLNANGGDIVFQGNRQGATFTDIGGGIYAPVAGTGDPNAIYLGGSGSLNMDTAADNLIHFYDPIASVSSATMEINKTGDGEVIFHGNSNNPGDALYNSDIKNNTNVNGGKFTLVDGVSYGNVGFGTFSVNDKATLQGGDKTTLTAKGININSGGTVLVNGGIFNLTAGANNVVSTAGLFTGAGTLVAPVISLSNSATNTTVANIESGKELIVDALLQDAGSFNKTGEGTLVLTKTNTFTGETTIDGGTLKANVVDIIAASSGLKITAGVFDLNNFDQTVKSLSGTGSITMGTGNLTVKDTDTTTYDGIISGNGSLTKDGSGSLTLTAENTYQGGTNVKAGTLVATQSKALSSGDIVNNGTLQLDFAKDEALANALSGTGTLNKTGSGKATLTHNGGSQGDVNVKAGTLRFEQAGDFNAANVTSDAQATLSMAANATLAVAEKFKVDGKFDVAAGNAASVVTAKSAEIGSDATFNLSGYSVPATMNSKELGSNEFRVITTSAAGKLAGDFKSISVGGAASEVDYLTLTPTNDKQNYSIGLGLSWYAAESKSPEKAHGSFTLADQKEFFDLGAVLADEAANAATNWDGKTLTKAGEGTLQLSSANTYTGATLINAGTLRAGSADIIAKSSQVTVADAGTFDLNNFDQHVNNLNGAGKVTLGSATLTTTNDVNNTFSGVISGAGNVVQEGNGQLTITNSQTYQGTTNINAGYMTLLNNAVLESSNVTIAKGAELGGYGGVNGSVTNDGLLATADAANGYAAEPAGNFTIGGNFTNNGEIRMASPDPRSQTIVKGNYIGNNGLLTLSTVLGGDNSITDKLVISGDTSGTTNVVVNNAGGEGAQTKKGIEVISVGGQSNGQFTLANRVVAGAYEYSLYQGLPYEENGNWYLRSVGPENKPQLRLEAGIYLSNQSMASVLQSLTLFDRQGSQFRSADSSTWGRIIGGRVDNKAGNGALDTNSDYTLIQVGGDLLNYTAGDTGTVVGVMGSWGDVDSDTSSKANMNGKQYSATGTVEGFSLGVYATWFADAKDQKGAYVDGWSQYGWYNNSSSGETMSTDKYDSTSMTSSLETGYSFVLNDNAMNEWRLIPQAQVVYNDYSADSFVDSGKTKVDGQKNDNWSTRLGSRVTGKIKGESYTHRPFAEVNWWYSKDGASVKMDQDTVKQDMPKNRAELKLGLQSEFDNNWSTTVSVGGQVGDQSYRSMQGGINVRYAF
ncbi:autotransporter outer membrane beta-barrel domain-containing protein [Limnobaculum zhutongyuii]|uniref:Autotransporter outer membrane beta-barrel domain-containing protein n=1 Tax=Limnobaculum zhutongyuii TaxID=2498113 RepID=A0A411WNA9_9GAMM|nr:autotransporter outer membrane beta-barrel domain-containing protein [Limnobaculum zhutongyuii]QBH97620.1 autotransporter outer membrane beta-barrel domain-containing protein [Limnobaculum zhutongyuii]TQS91094.1 autotransporter outer membrane beta-barrel domain-containing protein [Limnobaculum zhutongyuii]